MGNQLVIENLQLVKTCLLLICLGDDITMRMQLFLVLVLWRMIYLLQFISVNMYLMFVKQNFDLNKLLMIFQMLAHTN